MNKIAAPMIATLLVMASLAHAGPFTTTEPLSFYGGIGNGISKTDISRRNNDETSIYIKGFAGMTLSQHLGIEMGGLWFDDIDISGRDSVSQYDIEFQRYDIYAGPTLQFKPDWFIPVRLMAGATYSKLDMEVTERFYGLANGGSTAIDDHVTGTYIALGIVPFQLKEMSALVNIEYLKRADFFPESNRSLSFRDIAISFRLSFY